MEGIESLTIFLKALHDQLKLKNQVEFVGAVYAVHCINRYVKSDLSSDVEKELLNLLKG